MRKFFEPAGFSLLEMVIVASVVMTGFIGILILAQRTIQFRSINQKSLVAAQLAQEGLELVRYYRNANWLAQPDWPYDLSINRDSNKMGNDVAIFSLDYYNRIEPLNSNRNIIMFSYGGAVLDSTFSACDSASDKFTCHLKSEYSKLYLDSEKNNFYRIHKDYTQAVPATYVDSGFHRAIETLYDQNNTPTDPSDDYLYVVCKVYWQDRGKDYIYTTTTYLFDYDWYY